MTARNLPHDVAIFLLLFFGLAGHLFAAETAPLKVVIAYGQGKSELANFAKHLEANYNVKCRFVEAEKAKKPKGSDKHAETPFAGLEAFEDCDVIVSNLYRTWAPPTQLEVLKRNFLSKPIVGLRKAHHGFQNWLEADRQVFGVSYRGHYGSSKSGEIKLVEQYKDLALFEGLKVTIPGGGCYAHRDPEPDLTVYMVGGQAGKEPHPQTWSRVVKDRHDQRVFYTRYDPQNIESNPTVRRMVIRAVFWAANREPHK